MSFKYAPNWYLRDRDNHLYFFWRVLGVGQHGLHAVLDSEGHELCNVQAVLLKVGKYCGIVSMSSYTDIIVFEGLKVNEGL